MSKFVKCWHPDVEGEAMFAEASLPHQMKKGWSPVEPDPEPDVEVPEPKPKAKPKAKKTESPEE